MAKMTSKKTRLQDNSILEAFVKENTFKALILIFYEGINFHILRLLTQREFHESLYTLLVLLPGNSTALGGCWQIPPPFPVSGFYQFF